MRNLNKIQICHLERSREVTIIELMKNKSLNILKLKTRELESDSGLTIFSVSLISQLLN